MSPLDLTHAGELVWPEDISPVVSHPFDLMDGWPTDAEMDRQFHRARNERAFLALLLDDDDAVFHFPPTPKGCGFPETEEE